MAIFSSNEKTENDGATTTSSALMNVTRSDSLTTDLESALLNLEQTFYEDGFASGIAHGRLHGIFEGRALGKDHAWQLWEEVGYYQGFASLWVLVLASQGKQQARVWTTLQHMLALTASFPVGNDSSRGSLAPGSQSAAEDDSDIDIAAMLSALRAKYRTACAALGVRARLVAAASSNSTTAAALTL